MTPVRRQPPITPKRQRRTAEEKRRIVEATLVEGASMARVARAHGVNANQVFQWRRLYRAGRPGGNPGAIKLLPVTGEASPSVPPEMSCEQSSTTPSPGALHIKLGHAHVRIEGSADPVLLRLVLESLRG
ncbi:MAG: IS66-like element accessory protein TnpA [Terriglobales bacterium]